MFRTSVLGIPKSGVKVGRLATPIKVRRLGSRHGNCVGKPPSTRSKPRVMTVYILVLLHNRSEHLKTEGRFSK